MDEDIDIVSDVEEEDIGEGLSEAVKRLDKTQHIKAPKRHVEPVAGAADSETTTLPSVVQLLEKTGVHAQLGATIRRLRGTNATLPKPLETHVAEQIKRSTGFEEIKVKLDRWNAIVSQNRSAEHREFPLPDKDDKIKEPFASRISKYQIKSSLEKELEELQPEPEAEDKVFPLTMAEMLEHRKEMARLRAKQSYKEAKARRQSKIKSKKFHRIQRKEKIKAQLKEFEILQKTDPEEALKRLEQLEKTRAEERVTLRHKSTGQWAKNKLVRAKYDKETRQQLAEQLAISRDLTKKIPTGQESDSSDDEEGRNANLVTDPFNPWIQQTEAQENNDVPGGYRKYWKEKNSNKESNHHETDESQSDEETENPAIVDYQENVIPPKVAEEKVSGSNKKLKRNKKKAIVSSTNDWNIEPLTSNDTNEINESIDDMFDDVLLQKNKKIKAKLSSINDKMSKSKVAPKLKKTSTKKDGLSELSFKNKKIKAVIDEEMDETAGDRQTIKNNGELVKNSSNIPIKKSSLVDKIDPDKFVAPKPKHLPSALPDIDIGDDYMDDTLASQKMTIAEAFRDDDIVADFAKEKRDQIESNKPKVDDSFMPGWGSWTGKNMSVSKRKRRRFITAPVQVPRKDDKKPNLIIQEIQNPKLKQHLVSELPYPFTSVEDFESTVRAPLGHTFIPMTAHKKLTRPALTVKTGIVIKPMDESHLIDPKKDETTKKGHSGKRKDFKKGDRKKSDRNKKMKAK